MTAKGPWDLATEAKRTYITPEDITDAMRSGCDEVHMIRSVLGAISSRRAEDPTLCAFVALKAMASSGPVPPSSTDGGE